MLRFYIVPLDSGVPRYFGTAGVPHVGVSYGLEPVMLLRSDTDATQHAAAISDPEIYAFPDDIDTTIPNAPSVRADLEPYGIPLQWVTNGLSWRLVLRYCIFLFTFAEHLAGTPWRSRGGGWDDPSYDGALLPAGANFNTTWSALPRIYRLALSLSFIAIGWLPPWPWLPPEAGENGEYWGIPNTPIRDVLEALETYTQSNPYVWGEVTV